jgi:hypothetical protein
MLIEALRSEISTPAPDNKAIGTYVSGTEFLKTNYAIAIGKLSVGHEGVLKAHLGNATGEYRQRLLFILGFLRDESVHGEIATIFKESHDSYIRLAAITALGEYRDTLDVPTLETALYDSFYVYDFLDEAGKPINMWYPVKNVATSALLKMGYDVVWKDNKYIITRRE